MRHEIYWPYMANDYYVTVRYCHLCVLKLQTNNKERKLHFFARAAALAYVARDILGLLARTKSGSQFTVVVKYSYSKQTMVIPAARITATTVATIFLDHQISNLSIPTTVLTDNGSHFTSMFFQAVCVELPITPQTTMEYHPQTNGQVERYTSTIVSPQTHYVAEH